jgi:PBP1b-binding outer membrane lipoprotein LpoB
MKQLILLLMAAFLLASCGKKAEESKTELTPEQEMQVVDSAATETKQRVEEIGKSVDELQQEVDSVLNQTK